MQPRLFLRELFAATMRQASLPAQMRLRVRLEGSRLHLGEAHFDLMNFDRVLALAVGKAAVPMSDELTRVLATYDAPLQTDGVVVGTLEPEKRHAGFAYFRGGHPLPDEQSRLGAQAMLESLSTADTKTLVIFLISGGASAMLELPLDAGITVEDAAFNQALVRSGLPIRSMNVLRKHFSAVKGGRLAMAAPRSPQCTLLISDVPEGQIDFVGSGPSLPDPSTIEDCRAILRETNLLERLPSNVAAFFRSPQLPETPKLADFAGRATPICALLSSATLSEGAALFAQQAGFHPVIDNSCDDWDYRRAADYLVDRFDALYKEDKHACLISTGEVTVSINGEAGRGGRNQQFALEVARINAGEVHPRTAVLSAGSDGIDGDSPATGAVSDETTWQRAIEAGIDPGAALRGFNSFPLFEKLGDAIVTGPTGNNIRDLRVFIAY